MDGDGILGWDRSVSGEDIDRSLALIAAILCILSVGVASTSLDAVETEPSDVMDTSFIPRQDNQPQGGGGGGGGNADLKPSEGGETSGSPEQTQGTPEESQGGGGGGSQSLQVSLLQRILNLLREYNYILGVGVMSVLAYYLFYQKPNKTDNSLRKSRSHLYDARDALTVPHFSTVFNRIDRAKEEVEDAEKNNKYSLRDRTEEIEQRKEEVEQIREAAERTKEILHGEGKRESGVYGFLSDASEYRDENEYEKAVEACSEAIEIAKEAVNKFEDRGYETEAIEKSIAEAEELREHIQAERDIDADLTKVKGRIEKAESLIGGGSEDEAVEYLDGTWKVIDDCQERAAKRGFEGLVEKAEELRKRRSKVRDAVSGEGDTVPSEPSAEESSPEQEVGSREKKVPTESVQLSPATEVSYKDLEKGDKIGKGGQADVFLAFAPDDTTVALKEPRFTGTLHSEIVEGFIKEAETWGKLDSHDGIVSVFNYGSEPLPWIAMEYMDGGELGDRTEDMSLREGLWTATRIADAVWHAHRRGVAHLDLKPGNILFKETERGYYDIPKVSDWGLAKVLLEHSKSIDGLSVNYSAPEQFDPDEYGTPDDRTDVYQLGAVFYEMFTGSPPFEGGNSQVMYSVLNEEPEEPTRLNHELPSELDAILLDTLAKDRDDRYESVVYLRDELRELL